MPSQHEGVFLRLCPMQWWAHHRWVAMLTWYAHVSTGCYKGQSESHLVAQANLFIDPTGGVALLSTHEKIFVSPYR